MADQQEFCLRWNDFHSNFHVSLDSLRGDESFTDVTLSCSGKLLKAHKVILSACSAHFKEIFKMIAPQQHPVIVLPTVDLEVMQAILEFIYQGQVNVRQARLGAFLQVAETFSIQGLADEDGKKSAQKTPSRSRPPDAGPTAGPGPKRRRLEVPRQPSPAARAPEEPVNIDMSVKLEPSAMLDELDDILEPGGDRRLPPTPALDTADKVQSIITIGSEDSGSQANFKRRSRSLVWEYFQRVTPTDARCLVCRRVFHQGASGNTTNLRVHLRTHDVHVRGVTPSSLGARPGAPRGLVAGAGRRSGAVIQVRTADGSLVDISQARLEAQRRDPGKD